MKAGVCTTADIREYIFSPSRKPEEKESRTTGGEKAANIPTTLRPVHGLLVLRVRQSVSQSGPPPVFL